MTDGKDKRIAELTQALIFYAAEDTYIEQDYTGACSDPDCCTPIETRLIDHDMGELARAALAPRSADGKGE